MLPDSELSKETSILHTNFGAAKLSPMLIGSWHATTLTDVECSE